MPAIFLTGVNAVFEVIVCSEKWVKKAFLLATQRAQITVAGRLGYSERMIASKLHGSKTAVHTAKVNFMKYGNYEDRKISGRL